MFDKILYFLYIRKQLGKIEKRNQELREQQARWDKLEAEIDELEKNSELEDYLDDDDDELEDYLDDDEDDEFTDENLSFDEENFDRSYDSDADDFQDDYDSYDSYDDECYDD